MYGAKSSTKAPAGFTIGIPIIKTTPTSMSQPEKPVDTPRSQNRKSDKIKYCSKCGSAIDNKTKKCTGCGKQYFRESRSTKFAVTVIIMGLVIAALSTICVLQYQNNQTISTSNQANMADLENKVIDLEQQVRYKDTIIKNRDSTIKSLKQEVNELMDQKWDYYYELQFYNDHAALVD